MIPRWIRDPWWVVTAYIWGKVFRSEDYVPMEDHDMIFFPIGAYMGERRKKARLMKLIWLWGLRLPEEEEVAKEIASYIKEEDRFHARFFFLRWKR